MIYIHDYSFIQPNSSVIVLRFELENVFAWGFKQHQKNGPPWQKKVVIGSPLLDGEAIYSQIYPVMVKLDA